MKPKVLFLCTGNSCRSQMAEGWARHLLHDQIEPYSAGIEAHGMNPIAIRVMLELGVDIYDPLQPEAMNIWEIKKRYGRRITLRGGIGTQQLLMFGNPARVRDEVRKVLDILGHGGGYIAAPAKPLMPNVPLDNVMALVEALTDQPA